MTTKKQEKVRSNFKKKIKKAKEIFKKSNISWASAVKKAFK
jgi:hypothetical protein